MGLSTRHHISVWLCCWQVSFFLTVCSFSSLTVCSFCSLTVRSFCDLTVRNFWFFRNAYISIPETCGRSPQFCGRSAPSSSRCVLFFRDISAFYWVLLCILWQSLYFSITSESRSLYRRFIIDKESQSPLLAERQPLGNLPSFFRAILFWWGLQWRRPSLPFRGPF